MHVDIVYKRTAQLGWTEVVTCPHCGLRSKAGVEVRGVGAGRTHYGIGRETAVANAGVDAFSNAVDSGRAMLRRARCPRCGKRAGGVPWLSVKSLFGWGIVAGIAVGVASPAQGPGSGLLAAAVIAVAILTPLTIWARLRAADTRVRFEELFDPSQQPAPTLAPEPARPERAASSGDELELDVDRSWNKRG